MLGTERRALLSLRVRLLPGSLSSQGKVSGPFLLLAQSLGSEPDCLPIWHHQRSLQGGEVGGGGRALPAVLLSTCLLLEQTPVCPLQREE